MIAEKDDIFVYYNNGEGIPAGDTRFSHIEWEGGVNALAFESYIEGYYEAARILYEKMRSVGRDYKTIDTLIYPLCFNIRHSIEMYLKLAYLKFAEADEQSFKDYLEKGHDLNRLWSQLKPILSANRKRVGSSVSIGAIEHYIRQWAEFDKNAMRMRYPSDKDLEASFEETRLDYVVLWDRMLDFKICMDRFIYDIDHQVSIEVDEAKVSEYQQRLETEKEVLKTFLKDLSAIAQEEPKLEETKGFDIRSLLSKPDKKVALLNQLSDNQRILVETLFYVGQEVGTKSTRLPLNPTDAKTDVIKCCVWHMDHFKMKFDEPIPEYATNLWGKSAQCMLRSIKGAWEVIFPQYQILVLGGTGAMGVALVDILNKKDDKFHVVVTTRQSRANFENVEYRQGNAHDTEWLNSILEEQKWDAIVDFMVYTTEEFTLRVDLLLKATKQYVFISSARVYADSGDAPLTEQSPRLLDVCTDKEYLATDEYALTKARQENCLLDSKSKNWTIIRPYITFSEERLQLGVMEKDMWLIPALNNRPIVFSRDIASHYTTMTSGDAVSKCIASLLTKIEARGEIYNIASSESHKWEEIVQWYNEAFRKKTGAPFNMYYTNEWNSRFGGGEYQWKYDRLFNRRFDNTKILNVVSNDVFEPMEATIKKSTQRFIENYKPNIFDLNLYVEYERGLLTGDFLPMRYVPGKKHKIKVILKKLHLYKL